MQNIAHSKPAVTGIFQTGRLLAVGPLTTTAERSVTAESPQVLPQDRRACTCELCGIGRTQSQTIPASRREEHTQTDRRVGL